MEKLGQLLKQMSFSLYELLYILWNKVNDVIDKYNELETGKTDLTGDHKGTWNGLNPSQTDQSVTSLVESLDNKVSGYDDVLTEHYEMIEGHGTAITNLDNSKVSGANIKTIRSNNGVFEYSANGVSYEQVKTSPITKGVEVLSTNPTGAELYEGRMWIKVLQSIIVADTFSTANATGGGVSIGAFVYKVSPNYKPTRDMLLKEFHVKMITSATVTEHNTSNTLRCRICPDNGAGLPNEASPIASATFTSVPASNGTSFTGIFSFSTPVELKTGTLYHFVLDIPTGTGNTMCQTYLVSSQPTTDEHSAQTNSGTWNVSNESWLMGVKYIIIE
jgi:hypothetical protein